MRDRRARLQWVTWFLVGVTIAFTVQYLRATATGGAEGLVFAGELEPAHVIVEQQLPSAPIDPGYGHDGQIFFAVASDLTAKSLDDGLISPVRYRRILFPVIASVGGLLEGRQLLWGLIVTAVAGVGISAGAAGDIAHRLRMPWLTPLAVVLNPGLWLSAVYLTADTLAVAFGLLGVSFFLRKKHFWAVAALAAAGLTKETHLAFALGIAAHLWMRGDRNGSERYFLIPLIPVATWFAVVGLRVGNPFASGGGLTVPLHGLISSSQQWSTAAPIEQFFTGVSLVGAAAALITVIWKRSLLRWLVAPWLLVAILSSHLIWDLGNNTVRVLAPLVSLGVMGLFARSRASEREAVLRASPRAP